MLAADNELTAKEKADGWRLLFDGRTLDGWMTSSEKPSKVPVEDGCINPQQVRRLHDGPQGEARGPRPVARLQDQQEVQQRRLRPHQFAHAEEGCHDTGAIYDLAKPKKNAMKPVGEWNRLAVTCRKSLVEVELNGEKVTRMDMDEYKKPNVRPDGTAHKFDIAYKDHPRKGYIGLQDHGSPCWFKNIKLKPLK